MLLNPDVETWLLEELQSSPWPFEPNHRSPRLDATVLEVMRRTPPVGGFRRNRQAVQLGDVEVPENRVIQVVLGGSSNADTDDLDQFRPQRHLDGSFDQTLLPFGGGERVCLGKALAELEIRLMVVGLLQTIQFNETGSGSLPAADPKPLTPRWITGERNTTLSPQAGINRWETRKFGRNPIRLTLIEVAATFPINDIAAVADDGQFSDSSPLR